MIKCKENHQGLQYSFQNITFFLIPLLPQKKERKERKRIQVKTAFLLLHVTTDTQLMPQGTALF